MDKSEIAKDNGVDLIIAELDNVYLKDKTTQAFCAVKDFVEYRRQSGVNFSKFIVEWSQKYGEVKKHKMALVDGVQGYFLLVAANLTAEHERLVRATAKLEFEDIKDKLQREFGEFGDTLVSDEAQAGVMPVKNNVCILKATTNEVIEEEDVVDLVEVTEVVEEAQPNMIVIQRMQMVL